MRLCISCIDTLCTVNLGCASTMFDNEKHENQGNIQNNANIKTNFEQVSKVFPKFLALMCAYTQPLKIEYISFGLFCFLVEPKWDLKWIAIWYWFGILGLQKRVMQNNSYLELLTQKDIYIYICFFELVTRLCKTLNFGSSHYFGLEKYKVSLWVTNSK